MDETNQLNATHLIETNELKGQITSLQHELEVEKSSHQDSISKLNHQLEEMEDRVEQSEKARDNLKNVELEESSQHVIKLEEELYQAK